MPENEFDISVVIPAKNEEGRLPQFLQSLIAYCQKSRYRYELIVVDDGSSDKTSEVVLNLKKSFPSLILIRFEHNQGKGASVKHGLLSARGQIALFMDADGSTPAEEIEKNLGFLTAGYDIVIGSRALDNTSCSIKALPYRKLMGRFFSFFVHRFLIKDITDTQCGFKIFRRSIIRPLWENIRISGFGFDLEVLFLAQRMNYKIKEVSVNWTHRENSKINLVKDSLTMLINIFQIKKWYSGIRFPLIKGVT
jgi:dolichyl-phosphate beta-glucosyltransferase